MVALKQTQPVVLPAEVERRLRDVGRLAARRGFHITSELTGIKAHDALIREGYAQGLSELRAADVAKHANPGRQEVN